MSVRLLLDVWVVFLSIAVVVLAARVKRLTSRVARLEAAQDPPGHPHATTNDTIFPVLFFC